MENESMTRLPKRPKSLALFLVPVIVTMAWIASAAGPIETLAVDYPPYVYPSPTPTSTPTPTVAPASVPLGIRTNGTLGTFLVDPTGLTLYTLSSDPANGSTCLDQCVAFWPPLLVAQGGTVTTPSGVTGTVGTFVRADGSTQVSVAGRALYHYVGDSAAGDTNGEGIVSFGGTWHVARATSSAPVAVAIRIVGGNWNPPGNDNHAPALNAESVRIKNFSSSRKSLTGWRILDYRGAHVYRFPTGFSIGPGVTVTVFSGRGTRTATHLYWGRTTGEVWGNAFPERAYLRDATGKTVSTFTLYPY
jgi:predicted lipoprotein with Yx(FWY)xxD motif